MRLKIAFLFLGDCQSRYEDNILTLIPKLFTVIKFNKHNRFAAGLGNLQVSKMLATNLADSVECLFWEISQASVENVLLLGTR